MSRIKLPYISLPHEFLILLKANFSTAPTPTSIIEVIKDNRAIYKIFEMSLAEFSDGQNLEKAINVLGWSNFKERIASIFLHKEIYGDYSFKTHMHLIEEIKVFETRFRDHSVTSFSRLFLLGFYLKLANMELLLLEDTAHIDLQFGSDIDTIINLSQGRSEKIDWLLLIVFHLNFFLGHEQLSHRLKQGLSFEQIYHLVSPNDQLIMSQNLLAYGASIKETDFFLFEKV